MDAAALAAMVGERTRLIWLEAPGSVTMEFPDLLGLVRVAREKGVTTALDNTWGAGLAFDAFALPGGLAVDISVQALTKYPSGGADVLMGSVTTRDEALHLRLKGTHMRMGWGIGANDVEVLLRSLPTMGLRYEAQDHAGRTLAQWFGKQHGVVRVLHPALPASPGFEHWQAVCTQAAGLFSVVFDARYASEQVDAFVDALRLFKIGYSWAGPVSLVVPYHVQGMRTAPTPYTGVLVRFSLGLESVDALIADCAQALTAAGLT
jgi:cystathionine beta-lyase